MAKVLDRDLPLKLRFRRILFAQGYWCPIEIELSHYETQGTSSLKRRSLTDLDVLGIKYDQLFAVTRVVGDCKSGKNVSDVNRLFWLKGVKDYFGADQAYLLRPIVDNHARAIAPKLGLRVLDEEALDALEKNLELTDYSLPIIDIQLQETVTGLWGISVEKGRPPSEEQLALKQAFSYLSYSYWYIDQNRNLLTLIDHFARIAHLLSPNNDSHLLLAYTGLQRFIHSLLEAAYYILAQGIGNVPKNFRNYSYGGPLSLREKEQFFQLLRKLTNSNEQLDPAYLPEVIELVGRMIRNPKGGADVLRHIEAIYLSCVRLGNKSTPHLDGQKENTAAIVLARDAAKTFASITGINSLSTLVSMLFRLLVFHNSSMQRHN